MNWLWKLLGYHVCEEFTQWEAKYEDVIVTPYIGDYPMMSGRHRATKRWQERRCTLCGKIQQEDLKHYHHMEEPRREKRHA